LALYQLPSFSQFQSPILSEESNMSKFFNILLASVLVGMFVINWNLSSDLSNEKALVVKMQQEVKNRDDIIIAQHKDIQDLTNTLKVTSDQRDEMKSLYFQHIAKEGAEEVANKETWYNRAYHVLKFW